MLEEPGQLGEDRTLFNHSEGFVCFNEVVAMLKSREGKKVQTLE